jgi:competence protein ComEA
MLRHILVRRAAVALGAAGLALVFALAAPAAAADPAPPLSGVVNVNTATLEELQMLPGVGEVRARAILDAREERGGFARLEDLVEVKGIGSAGLERLRPYLTLEGKTTAQHP